MNRNKSKLYARSRKYGYRMTAGACTLALLAGSLSPAQAAVQSYIQDEIPRIMATTDLPEGTIKVDFSALDIGSQKLIYTITQDGSYYFTGNNIRNETLVPAQIVVEEGVQADIYLDDLNLKNTDGFYGSHGTYHGTSPLDIRGNVTLHVLEESTLEAGAWAYGAIYIENSGFLTVESGKKLTASGTGNYTAGIYVSGMLMVNGGILNTSANFYISSIGNSSNYGEADYSGDIIVNGGTIDAVSDGSYDNRDSVGGKNTLFITGGSIKGTVGLTPQYSGASTEKSKKIEAILEGAENTQVLSAVMYTEEDSVGINYGVSDVALDAAGTTHFYVPEAVTSMDVLVQKDNEKIAYHIDINDTQSTVTRSDTLPEEMTYLVYEDSMLVDTKTGYIYGDGKVALPVSHEYEYVSFMDSEGAAFDGTNVQAGASVTAQRQTKQLAVTIVDEDNNVLKSTSIAYGTNLSEEAFPSAQEGVYIFKDSLSREVDTETVFYNDTIITAYQAYVVEFVDEEGNTLTDEQGNILTDISDNPVTSQIVEKDMTYTLPTISDAAYSYTYYDEADNLMGESITVTENTKIVAKKTRKEYTVTYYKLENNSLVQVKQDTGCYYGDALDVAEEGCAWIPIAPEEYSTTVSETVTGNMELVSVPVEKDETGVYYGIYSLEELEQFRDYVNTFGLMTLNARLHADIDATSLDNWTPIGETVPYAGNFQGQGHTIYYNQIAEEGERGMGLGGIFGTAYFSTIQNLCVEGTIQVSDANSAMAGGIVGAMVGGQILNCSSKMDIDISGEKSLIVAGGLAGIYMPMSEMKENMIRDCFSEGTISAKNATIAEGGDITLGGFIGAVSESEMDTMLICNSLSVTSILPGESNTSGTLVGTYYDAEITIKEAEQRGRLRFDNVYCIETGGTFVQGIQAEQEQLMDGTIAKKLDTCNETLATRRIWIQGDTNPILHFTHIYDRQVEEEAYQVSAADCIQPASYYYSCACGLVSEDVFYVGEALGHTGGTATTTERAICERCSEPYGDLLTEQPTNPTESNPTNPTGDNPTNPTGDNPTNPTGDNPTNPTGDNPTNPTGDNPTDSTSKDPSYPTEGEPTTPTTGNLTEPSSGTVTQPTTGTSSEKPTENLPGTEPSAVIKVGTKIVHKNGIYKVTSLSKKKRTVAYVKPVSKKTKNVVIPASITVKGTAYKVTAIAAKAFNKNKKVTKITIGKNVRSIGKKAFYGCKNLKKIQIKTTFLKKKTVGKKAFSGIHKNVKITMPKKCKKAYQKILKARGVK